MRTLWSQFILLHVIFCISYCGGSITPKRVCVIENLIANRNGLLAFATSDTSPVAVEVSYGQVMASGTDWLPWQKLPFTGSFSQPISNVACDHTAKNQTQIFLQLSDGQVYTATQDNAAYLKFSPWSRVGQNRLPIDGGGNVLQDSVSVGRFKDDILVFARSMRSNDSKLYWCKGNSTGFGSWNLLGGSSAILGSDVTVIKNPFSGKYEIFMISPEGVIHRTWQHNENSFAAWRSMDFAPKFMTDTRPTAGVMGYSIFNGKIMVTGLGWDGYAHRCSQSTCDSVDNPWGYCTWGNWHQTGTKVPLSLGTPNNLAMSRNVHFGMELFMVDSANGQLWQAWQLERDASWHGWDKVPPGPVQEQLATLPYLMVSAGGWWTAFGQSSSGQVVMIEPARTLNATPNPVAWGANLTVSWSVSVDEATQWDWVAIFPSGATNNQYVDYRYVQGGLNPGRNPVQTGQVNMSSYLPYGMYQVRYLVNSKYVSVIEQAVTYFNQSSEPEVIQLYRGIFEGLGVFNKGIEECVDEGSATIEKFERSFDAFEHGKVFDGLNLFGEALQDVVETLRRCEEIALADELAKFVKDLMECTEDDCTSFVIDIMEELIILYMNEYEIYGDIQGASNSFGLLEAYQQGGLCIGRLVNACLIIAVQGNAII